MIAGKLFVVSTPIGNMGDLSLRAVEVLRSVSAILAEDTRHSRHLLDRFEISTPLVAYHEHNEARATPGFVKRLLAGESFALISDAGTPVLSDPGARLVAAAADAQVIVSPVPGASALLAALVVSGLASERFTFFGFLARKGAERRDAIRDIASLSHTAVLYEAPARVGATLAELVAAGAGERATIVARELTKQFEEVRRGTLAGLAAYYEGATVKGEVVIVISGAQPLPGVSDEDLRARTSALRGDGLTSREIVSALVSELGASRNVAYRIVHE